MTSMPPLYIGTRYTVNRYFVGRCRWETHVNAGGHVFVRRTR
jgi:hypothetical protein